MIEINGLTVRYQNEVTALDAIDLKMDHKCTFIIGMNGSGKSTLLTTLVGLNDYTGHIQINQIEMNPTNLATIRQKVGMVFQNPDDQLFMSTIYDDLAFGLINMSYDSSLVEQKVKDIAQRFHFEEYLQRSSHKLSGGQKRTAALMSVLVMEPEIILMDEPTSFLDPISRRRLIEYMKDCKQQLIISTHDLDLAYALADEVILLDRGQIIKQGSKEILKDQMLLEAHGLELPFSLNKDQ